MPGWRRSARRAYPAASSVAARAITPQYPSGVQHAFALDGGLLYDLDSGGDFGAAYRINDAGQIAGQCVPAAGGGYHACLWPNKTSPPRDLTPDTTLGEALDINQAGQAVGDFYSAAASEYHAFLWDGTALHDLNDLIAPSSTWILWYAVAINSKGQIVLDALDASYQQHWVLLTPSLQKCSTT